MKFQINLTLTNGEIGFFRGCTFPRKVVDFDLPHLKPSRGQYIVFYFDDQTKYPSYQEKVYRLDDIQSILISVE